MSAASAVRIVGGVVPASLLTRITSGEVADKASLAPSSYHLVGNETVRDAASRAWGYLRGAWETWRETEAKRVHGPVAGPGTGPARERWLLPLLRELGYGQVPALRDGLHVEGNDYPVSHAWGGHVPIHLLGPRVDLDKRNPGVAGAARAPQAMVQELLNRSDDHLWAILSNGLRLRLLRDSTALAGSAYLEFDLEAIFDGEVYADWLLLFQICHVSRLEVPKEVRGGEDAGPADCWLEGWRGEAVQAGTRALEHLRDGVEAAIVALGTGFLAHPANRWLVEAFRVGGLTAKEYHRALLRLVYRLLFCFVAEDRGALFDPAAPQEARERYDRYFGTKRLRRLARLRAGGPHADLWRAQRLVLGALGGDGLAPIAVPALGGIFDPDRRQRPVAGAAHRDLLLGADLANADLLEAVRRMAWFSRDHRAYAVDYRNLGAEELGGVYESLLELIPEVDAEAGAFRLVTAAGNERKTTGSYYTPPALVSALLDTALDPLLDEAISASANAADAERRLLALRVCDPASGSGGFLVAAARRIARRLAQTRSGEDEPTPRDVQHALRDVVGQCLYGVDVLEMAAELCKVSLWLEALEPGKPLGFLDARIRVGNSLLGTTPALLAEGVPDEAFKELEGDEKTYAAAVRKRNKQECAGQATFTFSDDDAVTDLALRRLDILTPADDVATVRQRAEEFAHYQDDPELARQRLLADAWTSAFVWPLHQGAPEPPTTGVLASLAEDPDSVWLEATVDQIDTLAFDYRFFHWHLEFPEVFTADGEPGPDGWTGGFDLMIGNPPWERVKLQEQEFFAARDPEIAKAPNAATRRRMIARLRTDDPPLYDAFLTEKRKAEGVSALLRTSGRYPLGGRGDVNTYAVFAELFRSLTAPRGQAGVIVPTGIATDATTQHFFKDLVQHGSLVALYDFENRLGIFEAVDSRMKFCLLTMAGRARREQAASFAFFLHDPADIAAKEFALTPEEITLLNPNTGTCPVFRARRDAELTISMSRRVKVLDPDNRALSSGWNPVLLAMFHSQNDSDLFLSSTITEENEVLPLYEAKMAGILDDRAADIVISESALFRPGQPVALSEGDHRSRTRRPKSRFYVLASEVRTRLPAAWPHDWLLAWRDITSSTNERTLIPTALPMSGCIDTLQLAFPTGSSAVSAHLLLANLAAFVADYVARQKVGGNHIKFHHLRQMPVVEHERFATPAPWGTGSVAAHVEPIVTELVYTSDAMAGFPSGGDDRGTPFMWDSERRFNLKCELDAIFFHLYGVEREDVDYILDTFPIVRRKDEAEFGEYRTKRVILEVFDAMQRAIDTGEPYRTILDPPPGEGPRHPKESAR